MLLTVLVYENNSQYIKINIIRDIATIVYPMMLIILTNIFSIMFMIFLSFTRTVFLLYTLWNL